MRDPLVDQRLHRALLRRGVMSVTIKDVAAVLGISPSTVSRAFGRPEKVDEQTRRRIMATADELGYRPNLAARALNTGRTQCIGAILPDLENPFFAGVLKGIEQAGDALGYQTLVADSEENPDTERRAAAVLAPQVDGLLLCSSRLEDKDLLKINAQRPVVLVNRTVGDLPHVSFDSQDGMTQAVRHLAALGHRRLGYAGAHLSSRSARVRLAAFTEATDDSRVSGRVLGEFPPTFEGGGAAADAALTSDVTAVIVYNDVMAIGLTHRLLSYGVDLPGRLSVVGFDNVPIAAMITPSLTTVDLPRVQAGRMAAELLHAILGPDGAGTSFPLLETRLVVRQSTAPVSP